MQCEYWNPQLLYRGNPRALGGFWEVSPLGVLKEGKYSWPWQILGGDLQAWGSLGVPLGAQGALRNLWVVVPRALGSTQVPSWASRALGVGCGEPWGPPEGCKSTQDPMMPWGVSQAQGGVLGWGSNLLRSYQNSLGWECPQSPGARGWKPLSNPPSGTWC